MQAQDVHAGTGLGVPMEQASPVGSEEHADNGHKKRTVMGKVKDKARKLKTKMKKPKSPGGTGESNDGSSSGSSSDEEESGSDPHQQHLDEQGGEERDVVVKPGLKGAAFDAVPDQTGAGMHERFGQLKLGDEPGATKLQQEVPSAPGQVSAGVSPYLAAHDVTPAASDYKGVTPMDYEQPSDLSKTSDTRYTPTSGESALGSEQQKPLKDRIVEGATASKDGVAATAASGAGALGLKSYADNENVEGGEAPKTTFEQAKEKVLGSSEKPGETRVDKPSITGRAAGTVTGLKDTIASKLGYGSGKNLTGESNAPLDTTPTLQSDAHNPENKSYFQMIQERAAGASAAVTSKLGYGDKHSPTGDRSPSEVVTDHVNPAGDNKTYTQKAREAAFGAKDAVATKLGYGAASTKDSVAPATEGDGKSYLQQAQQTAAGAKDAVASKLGYGNTGTPKTESAYGDQQNVPASTAARFHPGEEDRALSELITEKMSTGAATVKDTLMKPFGTRSGPPTPTTTPPPSSAAAVEADPVHTTVLGTNPDVVQDQKAGIVGKVTGVVSSLLGTSPSGKKKAEEAAGKAIEDSQAQAPGLGNVEKTY